MHQKPAPSESRAAAAVGERDPAREAGDLVRRPGGGTGRRGERASGVRRALPVQCTRPSTAPRAPSLRPGRATPRCRLPVPETRRRGGTQRARPPAGRAHASRAAARTSARSRAGAQLPGRSRLRLLLPPPLSRPEGGRAEFQAPGWFILRPRIIFTYRLSHSRQIVLFGAGTGGLFSKLLSLLAPAFQITSGNLWEELRGWKMLLRFAKGRKLCHPAGDLCHA